MVSVSNKFNTVSTIIPHHVVSANKNLFLLILFALSLLKTVTRIIRLMVNASTVHDTISCLKENAFLNQINSVLFTMELFASTAQKDTFSILTADVKWLILFAKLMTPMDIVLHALMDMFLRKITVLKPRQNWIQTVTSLMELLV